MANYIINHSVKGYEEVGIADSRLTDTEGNNIILVLDESTNDKLNDYYERATDILTSRNRLFLIVVAKESKIRKAMCNLVTNYRNYDIYRVDSKDTITSEYLNTAIERHPTIDEIQSFVGGDVSGYADIGIIILGIDDLVTRGDLEGLKRFIEEHVGSIENLTAVVEYMKKTVDTTNSKEMISRIEELKLKIREADNKLGFTEAENNKIKDENLKLKEAGETSKRELAKAMSKNKEMEQNASHNTPIMQSYSEINTSLIKCKVTSVIYFKEVTYVPYVNSLITNLLQILKMKKKKAKLIIYDNKVGITNIYKSLSIIGGNEFVTGKANFVSNVETFVVVEPNPTILTSILESSDPAFEVVIVYDRMRQLTPVVSGNNVVNWFIVNSSRDFKETQQQLRKMDKSNVITRAGTTIGGESLNIPFIPDYGSSETTGSAKISKYMKLQAEGNNKLIINTIFEKSRID